MTDKYFKIALYADEDYEEIIPLASYLKDTNLITKEPDLSSSAFLLGHDQEELLGEDLDFGQPNLILFQLEEIIKRLEIGSLGLLRSAKHDNVYAPYLLFEPSVDQVLLSTIYFEDIYDDYFPIDNLIGNRKSADLYTYLQENLEILLSGQEEVPYQPDFVRFVFDKADLLKTMLTMIDEIKSLYAFVGKELKLEFYFNEY